MNARSLHPSARNDSAAALAAPGETPAPPAEAAERACCCPAKAVVRVTMPPGQARPRETDLLLCGHHYRRSRHALAGALAAVLELPGTPRDIAAWVQAGPAPAS